MKRLPIHGYSVRGNCNALQFAVLPRAARCASVFAIVLIALLFTPHFTNSAYAESYSASISTSGSIDFTSLNDSTDIQYSDINVITDCRAGYDLTIRSSVNDNNLYLDGSASNNTADTYVSPSDGTTVLNNAPNTWGFFASTDSTIIPTATSTFNPVPTSTSTPATIRTTATTASESDIDDDFKVYYGAHSGRTLAAGTYTMIPESNEPNADSGAIIYVLTMSPTCVSIPETTFTLTYDAGDGTDAPDVESVTSEETAHEFTITNSAPIYYGYTFTGWTETANGTTVDYTSGDTITLSSSDPDKTLYPVYTQNSCPANKICYYDNGADVINGGRGTMSDQSTSSGASVNLIPSNYSKSGYGFAGWATDANATPYGPNANITAPTISSTGLALYAKWVKSSGELQSWRGCNAMSVGDVVALTDNRNDETYAVAKLTGDKCWTIESLRLDPSAVTITDQNTHNPTASFISEAANSSSSTTLCGIDAGSSGGPACNNQIQFNTNNLDRTLTQSYNTNSNSAAWYSYGVYYNWYTATAGNGTTSTSANTNVDGDICPKNWHLPTSTTNGEWVALNTNYNNGASDADVGLRNYPVNLIWSGDYNKTSRTGSYDNGRYWSATGTDAANAYRMGHQASGSKGAQPRGNYRKWDAFAVRCIRDDIVAEYSNVTVTFPQGVTSITFTNGTDTQTATPSSPTVSIAEDTNYTITATFAPGYELDEWTAGSDATLTDSTTNPASITITGDTTLTLATAAIPSYTVTVNLDAGSSSVAFYNASFGTQTATAQSTTVTLYENVEYTITGSFASGHEFSSWSTTGTGVLGSTTANPTTYTVTDTATLSIASLEPCGSNVAANTICYDKNGNDVVGTMGAGSISSSDTSTTLFASNFSRSGYGFAGWNTAADGTGTNYGPNETISFTAGQYSTTGLKLYAKWIASAGTIQSWTGCKNLNIGDVTALTDSRDSDTYAVAKLADGKCWMIENLRLDDSATLTLANTNNPLNDGTTVTLKHNYTDANTSTTLSPTSSVAYNADTDPDGWCTSSSAACYDQSRLRTDNTANRATGNPDVNTGSMYSYGNYYNWYSATAGNGTYSKSSGEVAGDLCPNGWRLPYGSSSGNGNTAGGFYYLNFKLNNDSNVTNATASNKLRSYPNNILYSGYVNGGSLSNRGSSGVYWSSTAGNNSLAYALSLISSSVSPGTHYNDKYIGRSVRCVASTPSYPVTVTLDSGISSVTFTDSDSNIQTATSQNLTVTLKEGATYTITAATTTGYEFASWSTTANGTLGSTTTNPTTYTVTDTATLTVTSQAIPTYTTTVNMDGNITSVSFTNTNYPAQTVTTNGGTATLRRGVEYTITATTASGYVLNTWSTTSGTLGSTTTNPTTYTTTSNDTLSVTSTDYQCLANRICYVANGADVVGTMGDQTITSSTTNATLLASNFSRSGYGFAGWNTAPDGTGTNYGPNETISFTAGQYSTTGLKLYAKWIASAGTIQSWTGCKNLNIGDVTALTDSRDSDTYAIAKLADGNCWMIENLRLENTAQHNTDGSLAQGYNSSFIGLATPESADFSNSTTANSLYSTDGTTDATISGSYQDYRFPRYNNFNTQQRATDTTNTDVNTYSDGNYYTWHAAIADTTHYSSGDHGTTSICPTGWRLPQGNTTSAGFGKLDVEMGGTGAYQSTAEASDRWRKYPANFLYSGFFYHSSADLRGSDGLYWSSTAGDNFNSYALGLDSSSVYPGTGRYTKFFGYSIRCTADPTYPVTVSIDPHVESVTFTDSDNNTQTATSQNPTVTLKEGATYTIEANREYGYGLASWSTTTNGVLGSTTANPTTYTVMDTATLTATSVAANSMPLVYDGNGLTFTNDAPTNTVTYNATRSTQQATSKYSHTSNISDDGTKNSNYPNSASTNEVITINGASTLHIKLTWGGESDSWDWVSFWEGNYPSYTAGSNYSSGVKCGGNTSGKYGGGSYTTSTNTIECDITGDTVTFAFRSDSGGVGDGYGYYAVITGYDSNSAPVQFPVYTYDKSVLSGTYAVPDSTAPHTFLGWSENPNATTATYVDEEDIKANFPKTNGDTPTLYAIYQKCLTVHFDGNGNDGGIMSDQTIRAGTSSNLTSNAFTRTGYTFVGWNTESDGSGTNYANRASYTAPSSTTLGQEITLYAKWAQNRTVTVNIAGTGINKVTLANNTYGSFDITETGSTVTIPEGINYTISSTSDLGYELASWSTTANGTLGSTTASSTTYSVSGDATLTATGQISPDYTVTVNMDENVRSVGFYNSTFGTQQITTNGGTATLRKGVSYTISASYDNEYRFNSWSTTTGGTLGSTTSSGTTYVVTGNTTLAITSTNQCPANTICYMPNGADVEGTMGNQTITSSDTSATLYASNFSRTGYGYAGWNIAADGTSTSYGPQETITFTAGQYTTTGLKLYAKWIASAGTIQSWTGCKNLSIGDVTALTDARDNDTYAVAKLADGNCWMIENLRLENTGQHNTDGSLAQGYNSSFIGLATPESTNFSDSTTANSLYSTDGTTDATISGSYQAYRFPRYNNFNTQQRAADTTNTNVNTYSDGNYYTWHAAIADTTGYSSGDHGTTSICPTGWRLPIGAQSTTSKSFGALSVALGGPTGGAIADSSSTPTGTVMSAKFRSYPNNFLYSGYFNGSSVNYRGGNGNYWSSTAYSSDDSYRLFLSSSYVRPGASSYDKYYGYSVRCTAETPTYPVTVSLDSHIESVTFTDSDSNTQTATSQNPTVSLKEGATYTITANPVLSYEFTSWSTTANGTLGSTTTNPTTYTVMDTATLTVASQIIPTYTATVNMDSDVTSVSFTHAEYPAQTITTTGGTVTLRRGVEYTITATFTSGHELDVWSTTSGTIANVIINPTTYAIAENTTLSVASTDRRCPANTVCYMKNGADVEGTMGDQTITSSTTYITLLASNFSRAGYGYAGWNTAADGTGTNYGPNETISFTAGQYSTTGLKLYAKWIASAGTIQSWTGCKNMNIGDVTALTDSRDSDTYAVAKLADGKCWMIENLRLDNSATLTLANTNNPLNDGTNATLKHNYSDTETHNTLSSTSSSWCTDNSAACDNQSRLRTDNTASRATGNPNVNTGSMYSYGNYYNWYSATAGNGAYGFGTNNNSVDGDLCPSGWRLPKGGQTTVNTTAEFYLLGKALMGQEPDQNASGGYGYYGNSVTNTAGDTATKAFRRYPNNYLYSGFVDGGSLNNRGGRSYYWSSTVYNNNSAYGLSLYSSSVNPGTNVSYKYYGRTVRCVANPTYPVTVSLDSHITSVTFTDSDGRTQTATSQNPTVTLREGVAYTITATPVFDYELASWSTTANGTLGSTATNPTTYTIMDTATLTVTSQIIPTYTTTVNMDSNITSVSFTHAEYPAQTITTNGDIVTLRRGVEYTVTATATNHYLFDHWSTTENGTLGSTTTNPTIYAVANSTTLSVISRAKEYMQDFTSAKCQQLPLEQNKTLYDRRDESEYTVARLQDDLCWMTSDLHLGNTTSTMTLTNVDTDTINDFTLPIIETSSTKTQWGTANSTTGLNVAHAYQYNETKNLYNWYAATAGTTYSNNSSTTSICPSNWKLLTKAQAEGYLSAIGETNGTTNLSVVTNPPLSFTGGLYGANQVTSTNKAYWTATGWQNSSSGVYFGYHFGVHTVSNVDQVRTTYGYQKMVGLGIRCILSINAVASHQVTVVLDSHLANVTFTDSDGRTQTATSQNPTVTLREGVVYTITATPVFDYELASWSTTANGTLGSTTTNPTTYTVMDTATLTVTSQSIPTYTTTVNMDSDVTSVSFTHAEYPAQTITTTGGTATLRRGVEYTITATTATDYVLSNWASTSGTLANTTTNPTTYSISGNDTLTATSAERNCPANTICYMRNGADVEGSMGDQTIASTDTSATLLASNFSRTGYGYAGWNTAADGTGTNYGPNETIAFAAGQYDTTGLKLYAKWIASAGTIQSWTGCKNMNIGDVTALTDSRDSDTYAVAKLADGKCWMIENLRLDDSATLNLANTNNPLNDGTNVTLKHNYSDTEAYNTLSSTSSSWCTTNSAACDDQSRLRTDNTANRATNSPSANTGSMYSYGNYYNWYSATAGNGTYSKSSGEVAGDLCPNGWRLPYGNSSGKGNAAGGFYYLNYKLNNDSNATNVTASNKLRSYPNNYIYSGDVDGGSLGSRGSYGYYWSSTASNSSSAYHLFLYSSSVYPGTGYYNKYSGRAVRCVANPTYPVTVTLDSGISSVTLTDPDNNTLTATTESPTVTLKEGISYTITANRAYGHQFASWSTTANGQLGSTTANPTTYTVMDTATLTVTSEVATSMPLIYDGNGLTFTNDAPTNTVTYNATIETDIETTTKYSHTANINDSGVANGKYANKLRTTDVITIPNATKLHVTIYYSTQATSDFVYLIKGEYTGSVTSSMTPENAIAKLSGGAKTTFEQATMNTYEVLDDTITFTFFSNNSTAYYGYYAIVTGEDAEGNQIQNYYNYYQKIPISGTYAVPDSTASHTFLGWSEDPNAASATYVDEEDIKANFHKTNGDTPTLYAIYQKYLTVHFNGNGSDGGSMADQTIRGGTSANLTDLGYTYTKHTFTGWNTQPDGSGTSYANKAAYAAVANTALGQEITLYAQWIEDETVTVNIVGTGIEKLTITNSTYGTQEITPATSGSAVIMRKDLSYTVTATVTIGYEIVSWTTTSGGTLSSAIDNPVTFTASTDTTLTITGQISPDYTVTVNFDSHVGSVSFYHASFGTQPITTSGSTVTLRKGVPYTVTSSYLDNYHVDHWASTEDGVLTTPFSPTTNYTVLDGSTLTLTSTPNCPANNICYMANSNDALGTMSDQSVTTTATSATLHASNFSRAGYGFAGWNTADDGTGTNYGPNETITFTAGQFTTTGLILYAKWVASAGNLQSWTSCKTLQVGDVTALTDLRDNQVYTVAKLADNNCWMVENLRLESTNSDNSTGALAQGYGSSTSNGYFGGLPNSAMNFANSTAANSLYYSGTKTGTATINVGKNNKPAVRIPRYNNKNTQSRDSYASGSGSTYSYGNYYNWPAAMANTEYYTSPTSVDGNNNTSETAGTSICPKGWQLPYGRNTGNGNASGGMYYLGTALGSTSSSALWRKYPNNFVYSGHTSSDATNNRGSKGLYLTSTANNTTSIYSTFIDGTNITTSSTSYYKYQGGAVRCFSSALYYDVTVSMDSHVSEVSFYDGKTTQTVTSSNSTVRLKESTPYQVTATFATGYELSTWTSTAHGTVSSANSNPTTYTINDTATLTIASAAIPSYNVTVNTDSNVRAVTFSNPDFGAQTITANGATVSLRRGISYTVSASFATGYAADAWTTDANGTVGSPTSTTATYTVTGTANLTLSSKAYAGPEPPSTCSTQIPNVYYMQDINDSNYATILSSLDPNTSYYLRDKRDNEPYCVAKLADGRLWMTSNLNLVGGTLLSSVDTDFEPGYTLPTTNGWATTGSSLILPSSSTTGFNTNNYAYVYNSGNTTGCGEQGSNDPCYSYYSWDTATLGSGRSINTDNTDAPYSICPKGWRLPTAGTDSNNNWKRGDFYSLATAYGASIETNSYEQSSTFYTNAGPGTRPNFLMSGIYNYSASGYIGSGGNFWSSTSRGNGTSASAFTFSSSNVDSANTYQTLYGQSVRCVAKGAASPTPTEKTIATATTMQEVSSGTAGCPSTLTAGQAYTLTDSRDNKSYNVARLSDGNCWMLDNLALDLTDSTVQSSLSVDNTNASNTTLGYLKGTTTRNATNDPNGNYATAGVSSSWSTNSYSAPLINTSSNNVVPSDSTSTSGSYKVGTYYNYCAATAGSYCYGDGNSYGTAATGNPTEDICPKGWRMPTGNSGGEYDALYDVTGYSSYSNYRAALHLPLSGYFDAGSNSGQGTDGYFWSSTANHQYYASVLMADASTIYTINSHNRNDGYNVRCILQSSASNNTNNNANNTSPLDAPSTTESTEDEPEDTAPDDVAETDNPLPSLSSANATTTTPATNETPSDVPDSTDTYTSPQGAISTADLIVSTIDQTATTTNPAVPITAGIATATAAATAFYFAARKKKDDEE